MIDNLNASESPVIHVIEDCDPHNIPSEVLESQRPILLKGLVDAWPAVQACKVSNNNAAEYILEFDKGIPVTVYQGESDIDGRIFYNESFDGFNFQRTRQTFEQTIGHILSAQEQEKPSSYYIGSTVLEHWLPGFLEQNYLSLTAMQPLASIWIGNQSRIAAHYDFPNNIACSVAGRRRFTIFAPEEIDNLYVGPLDLTPSGQAISLVDFKNPDFKKHPRFKDAMTRALVLEVDAGDAVFIPSMWWHHVEALDPFNVLVNFWWRTSPSYMGSPLAAMQHAILGLSELPQEQRLIWQQLFNKYVFDKGNQDFSHIPEQARGVLAGIDEKSADTIKKQLLKLLK